MTNEKLKELALAAEKEAPGEWTCCPVYGQIMVQKTGDYLDACGGPSDPTTAFMVAANPVKVLALLAEIDMLRAALIKTPEELHRISEGVEAMGFGKRTPRRSAKS